MEGSEFLTINKVAKILEFYIQLLEGGTNPVN